MQIKFAKAKGSLPFRTDVKTDGFDECAQMALKVFAKPNGAVPGTAMTLRGETNGAYGDALAKFWAQPTSAKQAAESVSAAMRRAQ
jgi:ABC-type glycerol-3-phosphate transport system substrate-binding protein